MGNSGQASTCRDMSPEISSYARKSDNGGCEIERDIFRDVAFITFLTKLKILIQWASKWQKKISITVDLQLVSGKQGQLSEAQGEKDRKTTYYGTSAGFLNLSAIDILGQIILCCRNCPLLYKMFSSISGHNPLDANSIPLSWRPRLCQDIAKCLPGGKIPTSPSSWKPVENSIRLKTHIWREKKEKDLLRS